MADRSRDRGFTRLVVEQRGRLLAAAYLMSGDRGVALDLVELSLARVYARWPGDDDACTSALHHVLHASPGGVHLPWRTERVELRDLATSPAQPQPALLADLSGLDAEQRRCVVARSLPGLSETQQAAAAGGDPDRFRSASLDGRERLAARQPLRRSDAYLAQELRVAVAWTVPTSPAEVGPDLAHGRFLVRRRLVRASVLAAVLVAAVLGLPTLVGHRQSADPPVTPLPAAVTSPVTSPAAPSATCAVSLASCRVALVQAWRSEMADVTISHLDPEQRHLGGYHYSAGPRYESGGLWNGTGGVLGVDVAGPAGSGITVYLQVATSQRYALRCGQQTRQARQACQTVQLMDGNELLIGGGTHLRNGLVVQYSPDGQQVVTLVAHSLPAQNGPDLSNGDLVALVEDAAVRLPPSR